MINSIRKRIREFPRGEALREKINELIDHRVRAITAGLSIKEMRAILRGDPPTEKPNPRYKMMTTSFIAHIRPRYYLKASTWFTHTFRLGWFTIFFFFGLTLRSIWQPTPQ